MTAVPESAARLSPEREAEIAARAEAATPGPWEANTRIGVVTNESGDPLAVFGGGDQDRADAEFTADAREDVPALLAALQYERYWSKIGWDKAHGYNERWVRDDERLAEERRLVARLRGELSRQGRAHKAELAAVRAERDAWRDQRNAVFATNERLLVQVDELGQARLHAENEARAAKREARDELTALRALELGDPDDRVSATCADPGHPTWLRAQDDTRGCPWCRVAELEAERHTTNEALSDAAEQLRRDRDRIAELEHPSTGPDTLAAWLFQRFYLGSEPWEGLDEDNRSYWEHEARAVRRAVARGGYKTEEPVR